MTTVIFLGAGASVDAGYPQTAKLLAEMKSLFEDCDCLDQDRKDWDQFDQIRKNATGIARLILHSSNPEIVLTFPDLAEVAREYEDREKWKHAKTAWLQEKLVSAIRIQRNWYDSRNRRHLTTITNAKRHFQQVAQSFFRRKNILDHLDEEAGQQRRAYLGTILSRLRQGDSVITTNWDILAERCLLDQNKWLPAKGYGFPVHLSLTPDNPAMLQQLNQPSQVSVLKLHGSAGWFQTMNDNASVGSLYLRHVQYLEYLSPRWCIGRLRDCNEPNPGHGPDMNPVIMFPSFLKQLDNPILQTIWAQSAEALNKASHVYFIGYSLPSADVAVHALLNPLRLRLSNGGAVVTVVDQSSETLERWRTFFGSGINLLKVTAKDYAAQHKY